MGPTVLPAEEYLNNIYIEQMAYPFIEKYLPFNEIFDTIDITSSKYSYVQREFTVSEQIKEKIQSRAMPMGESTKLNELDISRSSRIDGRTYHIGYKFRLTADDILEMSDGNEEALNDYDWGLKSMGFGIAYDVFLLILACLQDNAGAPTINTADPNFVTWDKDDSVPLRNLRQMFFAYKDPSLPHRITDSYLNTDLLEYLLDYCDALDIDYEATGHLNDDFKINKTSVRNFTFHDTDDFLETGEMINICQNPDLPPAANLYRVYDPRFGVEKANNDQLGDKTAMQINIITPQGKEAPHDTIIESWLNIGVSSKIKQIIQRQQGLLPAV